MIDLVAKGLAALVQPSPTKGRFLSRMEAGAGYKNGVTFRYACDLTIWRGPSILFVCSV